MTPELPQNPTAFSSNTQRLSVALDEAAEEVVLLVLPCPLLAALEVELPAFIDEAVAAEDIVEEVIASHKLPFILGIPAVPFA
jgi:hypothetical protein